MRNLRDREDNLPKVIQLITVGIKAVWLQNLNIVP